MAPLLEFFGAETFSFFLKKKHIYNEGSPRRIFDVSNYEKSCSGIFGVLSDFPNDFLYSTMLCFCLLIAWVFHVTH